jgi:phage-related protein
MWSVEYYEVRKGSCPVREFIDSLDIKAKAKMARTIDLLEEFGIDLGMPYAKHIAGKLWELRTRLSTNRYRIIYFFDTGKTFILLHGFVKKNENISKFDLEIARNRMGDYLSKRRQSP